MIVVRVWWCLGGCGGGHSAVHPEGQPEVHAGPTPIGHPSMPSSPINKSHHVCSRASIHCSRLLKPRTFCPSTKKNKPKIASSRLDHHVGGFWLDSSRIMSFLPQLVDRDVSRRRRRLRATAAFVIQTVRDGSATVAKTEAT